MRPQILILSNDMRDRENLEKGLYGSFEIIQAFTLGQGETLFRVYKDGLAAVCVDGSVDHHGIFDSGGFIKQVAAELRGRNSAVLLIAFSDNGEWCREMVRLGCAHSVGGQKEKLPGLLRELFLVTATEKKE